MRRIVQHARLLRWACILAETAPEACSAPQALWPAQLRAQSYGLLQNRCYASQGSGEAAQRGAKTPKQMDEHKAAVTAYRTAMRGACTFHQCHALQRKPSWSTLQESYLLIRHLLYVPESSHSAKS